MGIVKIRFSDKLAMDIKSQVDMNQFIGFLKYPKYEECGSKTVPLNKGLLLFYLFLMALLGFLLQALFAGDTETKILNSGDVKFYDV